MEQDKPVHSGLLLLPPQGKLLLKKTWHQKFCQLYKASKFGIERLEIYDSIDEACITRSSSSRIITLENCIKIMQKSQLTFSIITKTANYDFATTSEQVLQEWLFALQSVAFNNEISNTGIEEDNELYCSSGEGVFNVKLHSSEASFRCGLEPQHYILILTNTAIQLRSHEDNSLLYTWPYRFIRRYGYRDGRFTFEAGRKCDSGEGTFHLEHSNQQEIFRCVASKMKSMKKLLNGEPSSILNCGDHQFQAALSMEARSRSPLPPSFTTATSLQELDSTSSNKSINLLLDSSVEKRPSFITNSGFKFAPIKPPRKMMNIKDEADIKFQNYEPIDKYDEIEYRNEAWRTLGTDNINHTENIDSVEDLEEYVSWGRSKPEQSSFEQKLPKAASKIITQQLPDENNYDRLNFFGSCSKLNSVKAGYKQVSPAPVLPVQSPPSFNDYDEVETSIGGIRIADDSHLGYALIRKAPKEPVDHQFHNDDPYAIISKPKHV